MGCSSSIQTETFKDSLIPSHTRSQDIVIKTKNVQQRAQAEDLVQNFLLIWLDANINEENKNFRNSLKKLRQTVNAIEIFRNTRECNTYISKFKNEKAFLIVSGSLCESVVPSSQSIPQIYSIFIFCQNPSKYEQWATKEWPKVKGIFTDIDSLCNKVRQSARECDEDAVVITGQIEPSFMYTVLFKEIIFEIDFDKTTEIKALAQYARTKYPGDIEQLKTIDEFERDYQGNVDNMPIIWYSKQSFLYYMLNQALRNLDVDGLLKFGFFISHLHKNIEQLQQIQFNDKDAPPLPTEVFRGQTLTKQAFETKIKKGQLISFNNFLSTSEDKKIAIGFIQQEILFDESKVGLLFIMNINQSINSAPFARIDELSDFPTEKEILFSTHTIFQIQQIEEISEGKLQIWEINITQATESDDQKLSKLTEQFRQEITGTGWDKMGLLLWKMSEPEKAEQIYTTLLQQATNDIEKAYCYNAFGIMKDDQGEYRTALEFYERSLELEKIALPPNHPALAMTYNNIGLVHFHIGEYSIALSSYEQAIQIWKTALPPNHRNFAMTYGNIGMVYHSMGDYSKSLSNYEQSLEIWKIVLPSNHPNLASSYSNIGNTYDRMGDYSKALSNYERSLQIRKIALPPQSSRTRYFLQ